MIQELLNFIFFYHCQDISLSLSFSGSFSSVFVNQSFWQSGVTGKPNHTVWGFLAGGLTWFALPFCAAFAFGMTYWAMAIQKGAHILTDEQAAKGKGDDGGWRWGWWSGDG